MATPIWFPNGCRTVRPGRRNRKAALTFGRETQVGKVRLYTQRAVEVLRQIFEVDEDEETPAMDADFESSAGRAIDDLFQDA